VVDHLRRRLREGGHGVVAKGQDAGIGDLLREEIFQPECVGPGVGLDGVTSGAMDSHDAIVAKDTCISSFSLKVWVK
jgi:hypothetical protein